MRRKISPPLPRSSAPLHPLLPCTPSLGIKEEK